jgi:N-acyl-L-homoserine lactone synthetase
VVTERGWLRPEDLPDGIERDAYDDQAEYVTGWDGEVLIAAARLVYPIPNRTLPTEEAFDLRIEPRGQVVDAGRFIVTRPYSDREHRVLAALIACTWLEVRRHGYRAICAAFAARAMIRLYRRMGFHVVELGLPRHYWGEERYPVRFDVLAAAPALAARWGTPPTAP